MACASGVGASWSSQISLDPSSKPAPTTRRASFVVKMVVSVEKKPFTLLTSEEMPFTLQKFEEIFNAAKPIALDVVKGSRMWDVDGNEYIDYLGSRGPWIIGHADDKGEVAWDKACFDWASKMVNTLFNLCLASNKPDLGLTSAEIKKKKKKHLKSAHLRMTSIDVFDNSTLVRIMSESRLRSRKVNF